MLQASEKNPKVTNLIYKIKNFLKESVFVERSAKLVLRDKFRQESALYLPLFRQWQKEDENIRCSFSLYRYVNRTEELKAKEKAIWASKIGYYEMPEEFKLLPDTELDLTLLHILYNRLRKSTKFHLGSKEKEDAYIKTFGQFRSPDGEGYVSLLAFYAKKLSKAHEIPLEAFGV
jgi:hypothetical protein